MYIKKNFITHHVSYRVQLYKGCIATPRSSLVLTTKSLGVPGPHQRGVSTLKSQIYFLCRKSASFIKVDYLKTPCAQQCKVQRLQKKIHDSGPCLTIDKSITYAIIQELKEFKQVTIFKNTEQISKLIILDYYHLHLELKDQIGKILNWKEKIK